MKLLLIEINLLNTYYQVTFFLFWTSHTTFWTSGARPGGSFGNSGGASNVTTEGIEGLEECGVVATFGEGPFGGGGGGRLLFIDSDILLVPEVVQRWFQRWYQRWYQR